MTNESTVAVVEQPWQWRSFWWGVAGGLAGSMLIDAIFGTKRTLADYEEFRDAYEAGDGEQDEDETE